MKRAAVIEAEEGSAGTDKVDVVPVVSLRHYPNASEWNAIKNATVESTQVFADTGEVLSRGLGDAGQATRFIFRDDFIPGVPGHEYIIRAGDIVSENEGDSPVGIGARVITPGFNNPESREDSGGVCDASAVRAVRISARFSRELNDLGPVWIGLQGEAADTGVRFGLDDEGATTFSFEVTGGASTVAVDTEVPYDEEWHQATVDIDGNGDAVFKLDGLVVAEHNISDALPVGPVGIGWSLQSPTGAILIIRSDYVEIEGVRL